MAERKAKKEGARNQESTAREQEKNKLKERSLLQEQVLSDSPLCVLTENYIALHSASCKSSLGTSDSFCEKCDKREVSHSTATMAFHSKSTSQLIVSVVMSVTRNIKFHAKKKSTKTLGLLLLKPFHACSYHATIGGTVLS